MGSRFLDVAGDMVMYLIRLSGGGEEPPPTCRAEP